MIRKFISDYNESDEEEEKEEQKDQVIAYNNDCQFFSKTDVKKFFSQPANLNEFDQDNNNLQPIKKNSSGLNLLRDEAKKSYYIIYWQDDSNIVEIYLEQKENLNVSECIVLSLRQLNTHFSKLHRDQQLIEDATLFELYIAKKNRMPKYDYPALEKSQIIEDIYVKKFTLVPIDLSCIFITQLGKMSRKQSVISEQNEEYMIPIKKNHYNSALCLRNFDRENNTTNDLNNLQPIQQTVAHPRKISEQLEYQKSTQYDTCNFLQFFSFFKNKNKNKVNKQK